MVGAEPAEKVCAESAFGLAPIFSPADSGSRLDAPNRRGVYTRAEIESTGFPESWRPMRRGLDYGVISTAASRKATSAGKVTSSTRCGQRARPYPRF
jgi:hypothetical protein